MVRHRRAFFKGVAVLKIGASPHHAGITVAELSRDAARGGGAGGSLHGRSCGSTVRVSGAGELDLSQLPEHCLDIRNGCRVAKAMKRRAALCPVSNLDLTRLVIIGEGVPPAPIVTQSTFAGHLLR
jgi:hypothetical protein